MTEWWWAYLALGAFVGFFSGLLGIGGGSAMVPVLALIFAAKHFTAPHVVHLALGTCIATILFTSASSVLSHHRREAVNWRVLTGMVPGVMLGTFAGALLAGRLDARTLSIVFTALIYYLATMMLMDRKPATPRELPGALGLSAAGGVVGAFASLTATAGASLVVPFLVRRNLPVHEAIGTAAAVGWPVALAGTVGYVVSGMTVSGLPGWSVGFVYLPALAWIVVASMLMAPLGAAIAHRTPGKTLKRVFAVVLYLLATNMLISFF
ncbi:MAG: sulfite exporter TauE/SafE family protein [Betaproteobacteria bacterium]|nr:sulfite exporter TauE/SafE family protein [Betaproteobacteria bacterium]